MELAKRHRIEVVKIEKEKPCKKPSTLAKVGGTLHSNFGLLSRILNTKFIQMGVKNLFYRCTAKDDSESEGAFWRLEEEITKNCSTIKCFRAPKWKRQRNAKHMNVAFPVE